MPKNAPNSASAKIKTKTIDEEGTMHELRGTRLMENQLRKDAACFEKLRGIDIRPRCYLEAIIM